MTEALVVMKTVKQKKLTGKVTERHLGQMIEVTLLRTDVKEYRKEWAKHKAETRLDTSTIGDSKDSDEPEEVDFDRTIREKADSTSLDSRRIFLVKFLNMKLIQVKDIQSSQRVLGDKETPEGRSNKSKKKFVRLGDKAFKIQEVNMSNVGEDELYQSDEMDANLYMAFQGKKKPYQPKNEKVGKYEKKNCPIKCNKKKQTNGSLLFCNKFREKSKDERKELQKKTHCCIL